MVMIKVGRDNLFKVNTHFSKIAEMHFVFVSPCCLSGHQKFSYDAIEAGRAQTD